MFARPEHEYAQQYMYPPQPNQYYAQHQTPNHIEQENPQLLPIMREPNPLHLKWFGSAALIKLKEQGR